MIQWNKVTWYSKLCAVILFFIILPLFCFYIGIEYNKIFGAQISAPAPDQIEIKQGNFSDYLALEQKLIAITVDYLLQNIWNIRGRSFVSEKYPNRYYYTRAYSYEASIGYYDFEKDIYADVDGRYLNIVDYTTWIYDKELKYNPYSQKEFRLVGFDDNKLVFYETADADTPGPCTNAWVRDGVQYFYLDITDNTSIPKEYVIDKRQKEKYELEVKDCIEELIEYDSQIEKELD